MISRLMGAGPLVLACGALAAGCGSDDKSNSTASKNDESEGARSACTGGDVVRNTGLPAAFPAPGELKITTVRKDGPTIVLDGYWTSELPEAYREWRQNFETAGYKVLFGEIEAHDSEVSYSGSGRTGQVALSDDCTESTTTRVHITNRPA